MKYSRGDKVRATTRREGHAWPATVIGTVETLAGEVRYVVEHTTPQIAGHIEVFAESRLAPARALDIEEAIEKPRRRCAVRQYSDEMHCSTCGRQWEASNPPPPKCALSTV